MNLEDFCKSLPKVELHAHLNGSLSSDTLKTLYKMQELKTVDYEERSINSENLSSLGECFKIFDIAHSLTTTPEAVYIATCSVIKEFRDDNVIYLELRSTPRAVDGFMTKQEYVEAIIRAFKVSKKEFPDILVKLLISVNRKQGYKAAKENIHLAIDLIQEYPEYIVGIDLSGDPTEGDAFIELLETSRKAGLKIAAHCAEVPNETEAIDILTFKPDRLGHCTCIHPDLQGSMNLFYMLLQSKIPVELCLTSNVKCKTVPSYAAHHLKYLRETEHPICIATDDKGVFDTSLSKEFEIVGRSFGLTKEELKNLCIAAVNYSFATVEEKQTLLSLITNFDVNN